MEVLGYGSRKMDKGDSIVYDEIWTDQYGAAGYVLSSPDPNKSGMAPLVHKQGKGAGKEQDDPTADPSDDQ